TLTIKIVQEIENIDLSSLNWHIVYDSSVTPNPSDIAFGSSFAIITPAGAGGIPKVSIKSDELFELGDDFYLEMDIDLGVKWLTSGSDLNKSKIGIGYSSSENNNVFNSLSGLEYNWYSSNVV